ncbi:RING-H2 finger protein ATL3-like [Typha angustifolia]|uniref:RING-H2 finger protein ATL3-like n=1 Tax=Typha angustifolia TaxID=59011 RepID=UPI003C30A884
MSDVGHPVAISVAATAELIVAVVVVVFMIFVFTVFLYLYSKRHHGGVPNLAFSPDQDMPRVVTSGLDSPTIKALPLVVFSSQEFKSRFDCTICLSEISDGEEARMLPRCSHGFHVGCIDMWLSSNSTCPLCRTAVIADASKSSGSGNPEADPTIGYSSESPNLPTNMLFLGGSQDRVGGVMVIEIPRRVVEELPVDEIKSPTLRRMRSLRRMLTRGSRGIRIGSSCSHRGDDIEQGNGLVAQGRFSVPKTPMDSSSGSSNSP